MGGQWKPLKCFRRTGVIQRSVMEKAVLAAVHIQCSEGGLEAEMLVRNPCCNPRGESDPSPERRDLEGGRASLRSHRGSVKERRGEFSPLAL